MKRKNHTAALAALAALLLPSCGEDRTYQYLEKTEVGNWIETQMRDIYLYYQDMPQLEMRDYFGAPEDVFPKVLASYDDYSYIEVPSDTEMSDGLSDMTYGFDFVLTDDPTHTSSRDVARVLRIQPDSPAEAAGLKRGDFIVQVDGSNISSQNQASLESGSGATLTILPLTLNEETEEFEWSTDTILLTLPAAITLESNPLYLSTVIEHDGKRTGYLVYDEFKSGTHEADQTYADQMLQTFQRFKQQGVSDVILDLRYNQGGEVSCAQLMAALLVPSECIGKEFARFEFNDKRQADNYSLYIPTEYAAYNLNLNRLFIITGQYTAAASEMMINNLSPYMTVHQIGTRTVGKNVALSRTESPYGFVMYPVTSTILNANGESDYASGFTPEYIITELNYYPWYELGDPNELLLKNALQWVAGSIPSDAENLPAPEEPGEDGSTTAMRLSGHASPDYSSFSKKKFPAAILPQ